MKVGPRTKYPVAKAQDFLRSFCPEKKTNLKTKNLSNKTGVPNHCCAFRYLDLKQVQVGHRANST